MTKRLFLVVVACITFVSAGFPQDLQSRTVYTVSPGEAGMHLAVGGKTFGPYAGVEGTPWFDPAGGPAWAMALRTPEGKLALLVNGEEKALAREYSRLTSISMSPDGRHWSAGAEFAVKDRQQWAMIVDGKEYGAYDRVEDFTWAPAAGGWYFAARTGAGTTIVRGSSRYGPYPGYRDATFDAEGKRLAFLVPRADGSWTVRVDNREYGPYPGAQIVRTGNGAFLGYLATLKNGKLQLTVADKSYGPYEYVDWGREYVSPDGRDWLVMVFRNNRRILLQNGKETELGRLSVWKLAKGWLYTYEKGMEEFVVFNGTRYGPFETGRDLTVTRDGSTWAISHKRYANNSEQSFVTVNGKEYSGSGLSYVPGPQEYFSWVSGGIDSDAVYQRYTKELASTVLYTVTRSDAGISVSAGGKTTGPYREISGDPAVSADGSHWGVLARAGEDRFIALVDGKESEPSGPYAAVSGMQISPTGSAWAFNARPDRNTPDAIEKVVNGQPYGPYGWADRAWFSQDGSRFAFWAQEAGKNGKALLVFNGRQYGPFASDFDQRVLDMEAGTFALKSRSKDGVMVQVGDDQSGPWRDATIVAAAAQASPQAPGEIARYLGFLGSLKNGDWELHLRGGGTFGPYSSADIPRAWISDDGKDWLIPVRKPGAGNDTLLQNGVEQETQGFDLRRWAGGYLVFLRQYGSEWFLVNGQTLGPYDKVQGFWIAQDGRTWAAQAQRAAGPGQDSLILVNGKELPGEGLRYVSAAAEEYFTWFSRNPDGSGSVSLLRLR